MNLNETLDRQRVGTYVLANRYANRQDAVVSFRDAEVARSNRVAPI